MAATTEEIERLLRFKQAMDALDDRIQKAFYDNLPDEVLRVERAVLNRTMLARWGIAVDPRDGRLVGFRPDDPAWAEMTGRVEAQLQACAQALLDRRMAHG